MKTFPLALVGAALVAAATLGTAQIERLDLEQMVAKTDNTVFGTITAKQVFRIDHPVDGPELYFTTLTIQGKSLRTNQNMTVDVTFAGGFIDDETGVHNSEAPAADDVRVGYKVVAFYKWTDNMGGGLAANALYAAHGGLYTTFEARKGTMVQGRGEGYAITTNTPLAELNATIVELAKRTPK